MAEYYTPKERKKELLEIEQKYNELIKNQQTTPGLTVLGGEISTDYDYLTWDNLYEDMVKMRSSDCIASTSLEIIKLPILASDWGWKDPLNPTENTKKAKEYLDWTLDNLVQGFHYFKRHVLTAIDFGAAFFEKVYIPDIYEGQKTFRLARLSPIMLTSIDRFLYNDIGDFIGVRILKNVPEKGQTGYVDIMADKLLRYTYLEEFGDVRGRPILRKSRLVWKNKLDVIMGDARARTRQGGVATARAITSNAVTSARQSLRTVGNAQNAYFLEQEGVLDNFRWETPPGGVTNNKDILRYYDEQMFYGTLSHFLTAGIGGNGSRAATSEHKDPYMWQCNAILADFDAVMDELARDIISNSHLNISRDEVPYFESSAIKQKDSLAVVKAIGEFLKIGEHALTYTAADENRIREYLGLPVMDEKEIEAKKLEAPKEEQTELECACHGEKLELEMLLPGELKPKFTTQNIFELESAVNAMNIAEREGEKIIGVLWEKTIKKLSTDIAKNPNRKIELSYFGEWRSKLMRAFKEMQAYGRTDVKKELIKLGAKIELEEGEPEPIRKVDYDEDLTLKIQSLFSSTRFGIEDLLIDINGNLLSDPEAIEAYINERYLEGQKIQKSRLIAFIKSGYTVGRLAELAENEELIELFEYTAVLDRRLCPVCAPYDGSLMTKEEIKLSGLNWGPRFKVVNPQCEGGNKCRCQWFPARIKQGEGITVGPLAVPRAGR